MKKFMMVMSAIMLCSLFFGSMASASVVQMVAGHIEKGKPIEGGQIPVPLPGKTKTVTTTGTVVVDPSYVGIQTETGFVYHVIGVKQKDIRELVGQQIEATGTIRDVQYIKAPEYEVLTVLSYRLLAAEGEKPLPIPIETPQVKVITITGTVGVSSTGVAITTENGFEYRIAGKKVSELRALDGKSVRATGTIQDVRYIKAPEYETLTVTQYQVLNGAGVPYDKLPLTTKEVHVSGTIFEADSYVGIRTSSGFVYRITGNKTEEIRSQAGRWIEADGTIPNVQYFKAPDYLVLTVKAYTLSTTSVK